MGFSKAQQPGFRAMVFAAWVAHCRAENQPVTAKPDRSWYERELVFATSHHSTADCNAGRDYDRAMAHFEELSGTGITWQMKIHNGDAHRLLHELRKEVDAHDIDEDYLAGVARRMCGGRDVPLAQLSREKLIAILGEVKRYCRRRLKADPAAEPAAEIDIPF
jgi:hypothetical protein